MISDKVGRKPLAVVVRLRWAVLHLRPHHLSARNAFADNVFPVGRVSYVILTGYTSINALVKSELFPAHVRALGVGVGYALANSIFGGTAPLIYQALKARNEVPLFIAYVTACIAVSLIVYLFFIKNKAETYLDREQGAAFH